MTDPAQAKIPTWVNILQVILTLIMLQQVYMFYLDHQAVAASGITVEGVPDLNLLYEFAADVLRVFGGDVSIAVTTVFSTLARFVPVLRSVGTVLLRVGSDAARSILIIASRLLDLGDIIEKVAVASVTFLRSIPGVSQAVAASMGIAIQTIKRVLAIDGNGF